MSEAILKCPKCDAEMEHGYQTDFAHAAVFMSQWAKGSPAKPWMNLSGYSAVIKTPSAISLIPVRTYRCTSCGYLESYARKEFKPQ